MLLIWELRNFTIFLCSTKRWVFIFYIFYNLQHFTKTGRVYGGRGWSVLFLWLWYSTFPGCVILNLAGNSNPGKCSSYIGYSTDCAVANSYFVFIPFR